MAEFVCGVWVGACVAMAAFAVFVTIFGDDGE